MDARPRPSVNRSRIAILRWSDEAGSCYKEEKCFLPAKVLYKHVNNRQRKYIELIPQSRIIEKQLGKENGNADYTMP